MANREKKIEELEPLIRKLQLNRENVPLTELKTKYAASYEKLRMDIKLAAEQYMKVTVFADINKKVPLYEAERINQIIKDSNYMVKISKALYVEMDFQKFCEAVENLKKIVLSEWKSFLDSAIELIDLDNDLPTIRNFMTGAIWNQKEEKWEMQS